MHEEKPFVAGKKATPPRSDLRRLDADLLETLEVVDKRAVRGDELFGDEVRNRGPRGKGGKIPGGPTKTR